MNLQQFFNTKAASITLAIIVAVMVWWNIDALTKLNNANKRQSTYQEYQAKKDSITTPLILNSLPKKTPYWSISYDIDVTGQKTTLKIFTRSPHYRYEAYKYLTDIDPEVALKFKIDFINHENEVEE